MIRRIQVLNYRCLRHVDVHLDGSFHILVGPNAAGKSTLLDVISFLSDLVTDDVGSAVERRTDNFQDLVWNRQATSFGFELALEFEISELPGLDSPAEHDESRIFPLFRYEVAIHSGDDGLCIGSERGLLKSKHAMERERQLSFKESASVSSPSIILPSNKPIPSSILTSSDDSDYHCVFRKSPDGTDTFNVQIESQGKLLPTSKYRVLFGSRYSALKHLPEAAEFYPVATAVRQVLQSGVRNLFLYSRRLRQASPPNLRRGGLVPDGSNLPWEIKRLRALDPDLFKEWLDHVRLAIEQIEDIRIVEREDDQHAYLMLRHTLGVTVPSWTLSDGTLRLLALTLAAYLPEIGRIFLIEEPENGIHPMALEIVYQSLSSIYDSQVLVTSHSPVFLRCAAKDEILCFATNKSRATEIIAANRHPRFAECRNPAATGLLFSSDIFE